MTINITSFFQAIGIALAPAIYLGIIIYGKDKVEKQPKKDLLIVFLLGILIVPISAIFETQLESTIPFESQSNFQLFIQNFCVVAFIEEMLKFLVFILVINRLSSFTEPFDGIVFGTFLALGFSSFENCRYAYMSGFEGSVFRIFTSVPLHYSCGVVMGYLWSEWKFNRNRKWLFLLTSFVVPIIIHGLYDMFADRSIDNQLGIVLMDSQGSQPIIGIGLYSVFILIASIILTSQLISKSTKESALHFLKSQNHYPT